MKYLGYNIEYDSDARGYIYVHEDFDGAPDSGDRRCGRADSIEEAKETIREDSYDILEQELNQQGIYTKDMTIDDICDMYEKINNK